MQCVCMICGANNLSLNITPVYNYYLELILLCMKPSAALVAINSGVPEGHHPFWSALFTYISHVVLLQRQSLEYIIRNYNS